MFEYLPVVSYLFAICLLIPTIPSHLATVLEQTRPHWHVPGGERTRMGGGGEVLPY